MNFNPGQFAINMLNQNPQVANNPRAQELLQVIQNGFPKKKKLVVFTASFLRLKEFHFIWNLKLSMN